MILSATELASLPHFPISLTILPLPIDLGELGKSLRDFSGTASTTHLRPIYDPSDRHGWSFLIVSLTGPCSPD